MTGIDDLRALVDAAEAYAMAVDAVDTNMSIGDDDPLWDVYADATRRFEEQLGYGFAADPRDVAATVLRFAAVLPRA